ncbi:MAG: glycosyltransferase [Patescibacteria group bacterium]
MPESKTQSNIKPLVSVALPVFNRAPIIGRTIESILAQTFQDFELIIVDDGSTDGIEGVMRAYEDDRMRYVRHAENRGLMAARNTGVRESLGVFLAFQDSDDIWHPKKLEEEIALLHAAPLSVGGVYSRVEKTYINGSTMRIPSDDQKTVDGNLLKVFLRGDYFITLQALLVRRECIDRVGAFDENFKVFGDGEFIIRFAKHFEFVYNPNIRVLLKVQNDSISLDQKKRLTAKERLFEKERETYSRFPGIYAANAFSLGRAFAFAGDTSKAKIFIWEAIRVRPWRFSYFVFFLLLALGGSGGVRTLGKWLQKLRI